jgi:hypothetical protein
VALAFAVAIGAPDASEAGRLLSPSRTGSSMAGVTRVQPLALDRRTLADLRGRDHAVVQAFPLGRSRTIDVVLERFTPFSPAARVEVMGRDGARALALPDDVYFSGRVTGEDGSRVFRAAGRDRVHGFVVSEGDVYPFGPDGRGGHRSYALRHADPVVHGPPRDFCYNDLHPEAVAIPAAELEALAAQPSVAPAPGSVKVADVAIETDGEFRAKFASDARALDYLASLAAAASAIYERDVAVRLRLSYVRLWSTGSADPWSGSGTKNALFELRDYWTDPANRMAAIAGPRTLVHFLSGRKVQGGIAYLNGLCSATYGYGVSQVYGSFDLSRPSLIWDVLVFAHELGHNFGSPHSHCYSPPLDQCYGQERGCYAGPAATSRGTIMSYCHLRGGGLSNIDLLFGNVVGARIGQSVGAAPCLGAVTVSTSTTSTTLPRGGDGEDGDGVPDGADECPRTPAGDLVDATGCSVCPCDGPRSGGAWGSHSAYLRCVRDAIRRGVAQGTLAETRRRVVRTRARTSTCGSRTRTRCCVYTAANPDGRCRIMLANNCDGRVEKSRAVDLGPGSCLPSPCAR